MLRPSKRLIDLESSHENATYGSMDYAEALSRFTAMWMEAIKLNPDRGKDWKDDLEPDLAIARILNGLPPKT